MVRYCAMFKKTITTIVLLAGGAVCAQLTGALPSDRLAFANQLCKRGMYREALAEYEAIRGEASLPKDELAFRMGEAYRNLGRTKEAREQYRKVTKDTPESKYATFARLNAALISEGEARIGELKALDHGGTPDEIRATALYHLGEDARAKGDARGAMELYRRVEKIAGDADVGRLARLRRASLMAASGNAEERRSSMIVYLDVANGDDRELAAEALYMAGMVSYRDARYPEATMLFTRLRQEHKDSERAKEARIYAAWASYLAGRYSEALEIASPLRGERNEDAYYLTAAALRRQERRQDALVAYDEALAAFPKGKYADVEWFERLALVAGMGDHGKVLKIMKERSHYPAGYEEKVWSIGCDAAIAVTNLPMAVEYARLVAKNRDSELAPNAVHRLAWLLERMEDWPRAAVAYRGLATQWPKAPNAAQALYQAGMAEARSGRADQARADWTELLSKYPDSKFAPEALYARAMEEIRKSDFRAAGLSLGELVKRFPDAPKKAEVHYWLGVASNGTGDRQAAEKNFRVALGAKPTAEFEREIKLELGFVLQKLGKQAEATAVLGGLLRTKSADRINSADLQWLAESMLDAGNYADAAHAAGLIEKRDNGPEWRQIGAGLAGLAHEGAGERDAAQAAYGRALEQGAQTEYGIRAALGLGKIETASGLFDEAKAHLTEAVDRARAKEHMGLRIRAYTALGFNEEERGDANAALGYYMLVGTLFDDPEQVPAALEKAAGILKGQGKAKEAEKLLQEKAARYPKAK